MPTASKNNLYGFPQPLSQVFPAPITAARAPLTTDIAYPIGQSWIDTAGNDAYVLVDVTAGSATWTLSAVTPGEIATLTASSGGALSPTAGTINLVGTANQITTAGSGSTITWTLPAAITAPGSLTTTTTLAAGTTLTAGTGITATTGNIAASAGAVSASTTVTAGTDLVSTAGNVLINGDAKQLRVKGGAVTDFIGTAVLVAGTVTVANTNIAATDRIFLQRVAANSSTTLGELSYTISAATSFTINSLILGTPGSVQTGDLSDVAYFIVRQL